VAQLNREEEWAALMRAAIDGDAASYRQLLDQLSAAPRCDRQACSGRSRVERVEDVVQDSGDLKRHTELRPALGRGEVSPA
jgi:hypothetical protein